MPPLAYVGSSRQVGPAATLSLLVLPIATIWCPPQALFPGLWNLPVPPAPGDELFLCWHEVPAGPAVILARGTLVAAPNGTIMFTNATRPGARPAAQQLGYTGPTNMSFVHVEDCAVPTNGIQMPQTFATSGWSSLAPADLAWLNAQAWSLLP